MLGSRALRTLLVAAVASNLGDGVTVAAAPLLAASLTTDPRTIGAVGVALTLPWLLFALPSGAVADRADRRWLMVGADLVRAGTSDLHLSELAGGLEPPTCCLQDSCAAGCATPAGGERVRDQGGGGECRRRRTSKRARAPATEALRLSTLPDMGMLTRASQESRTRRWRPVPSLPTATQTGSSASWRSNRLSSAVPSRPMHQTPESRSCSTARARLGTSATGRCSRAPAEVLTATADRGALRWRGTIRPWQPAASALRARAPRLWGSSTPSRARKKGGSRPARGTARSSASSIGWIGATTARTPWWAPLRASASITERGTVWTSTPRRWARSSSSP